MDTHPMDTQENPSIPTTRPGTGDEVIAKVNTDDQTNIQEEFRDSTEVDSADASSAGPLEDWQKLSQYHQRTAQDAMDYQVDLQASIKEWRFTDGRLDGALVTAIIEDGMDGWSFAFDCFLPTSGFGCKNKDELQQLSDRHALRVLIDDILGNSNPHSAVTVSRVALQNKLINRLVLDESRFGRVVGSDRQGNLYVELDYSAGFVARLPKSELRDDQKAPVVGDYINVLVIRVDPERRSVTLSTKAMQMEERYLYHSFQGTVGKPATNKEGAETGCVVELHEEGGGRTRAFLHKNSYRGLPTPEPGTVLDFEVYGVSPSKGRIQVKAPGYVREMVAKVRAAREKEEALRNAAEVAARKARAETDAITWSLRKGGAVTGTIVGGDEKQGLVVKIGVDIEALVPVNEVTDLLKVTPELIERLVRGFAGKPMTFMVLDFTRGEHYPFVMSNVRLSLKRRMLLGKQALTTPIPATLAPGAGADAITVIIGGGINGVGVKANLRHDLATTARTGAKAQEHTVYLNGVATAPTVYVTQIPKGSS